MTFQSYYGHFEWIVMNFSLTNALVVFQLLMNVFFHDNLYDFVICHIDGIFIFSKNMEVYAYHVHFVLDKFKKVKFYAKLNKCEFYQINLWNSLVTSSLSMTFSCITVKFKVWIGLP
jgi:hypothetical protein